MSFAQEVVLRNDTNWSDEYARPDQVAWLDYPECAVAVFTPDSADLPLSVHTVLVYLGSSQGNQDGMDTLAEVGVQVLANGEDPVYGAFDWGPEAFYATVTTDQLNELCLVDEENGLSAVELDAGLRLAVYVCPPDPETGESWPRVSVQDTSGIIIDAESPSEGNWLWWESGMQELADVGVEGSWIIRAVGGGEPCAYSGGGGGGGDDTGGGGGDDSGGGGGGDDSGEAAAPDLLSVTPSGAEKGVAEPIALVGTGFAGGASVTIGGLDCSAVVVTGDSAITARSPSALPAGVHDVTVRNADGLQDTLVGGFSVWKKEEAQGDDGGCGCGGGGALGGPGGLAVAFLARQRRRHEAEVRRAHPAGKTTARQRSTIPDATAMARSATERSGQHERS